jgi:hypothetical protein
MESIHIYELVDVNESGIFTPTQLKHTKAAVTRKTDATIYFTVDGVESSISRRKIGRVLAPNYTLLYLKVPDNELARQMFITRIDEMIADEEFIIKKLKKAKNVVRCFKD